MTLLQVIAEAGKEPIPTWAAVSTITALVAGIVAMYLQGMKRDKDHRAEMAERERVYRMDVRDFVASVNERNVIDERLRASIEELRGVMERTEEILGKIHEHNLKNHP